MQPRTSDTAGIDAAVEHMVATLRQLDYDPDAKAKDMLAVG
jgi:hypothetical protein